MYVLSKWHCVVFVWSWCSHCAINTISMNIFLSYWQITVHESNSMFYYVQLSPIDCPSEIQAMPAITVVQGMFWNQKKCQCFNLYPDTVLHTQPSTGKLKVIWFLVYEQCFYHLMNNNFQGIVCSVISRKIVYTFRYWS